MRRVLVTGGAGFIGSNFVRYLLEVEPEVEVVNIDALTYAGTLENLRDLPGVQRYHWVEGDIGDTALVTRLLREHGIDTIVHFAAETHVDRSIIHPERFFQTNVLGTLSLLEAARQVWLDEQPAAEAGERRFHHVSTDEVYGSLAPDEPAFSEATPYAPNSPYAASKAASDHLVRSYHHTFGLPISISNCSNNYGPNQFPEKLIPLMIYQAQAGKPLPVYGDGQQIRDWLFVQDHCEAIRAILTRGRAGETYNIGGGNQPTNLSVVGTLCDVLDELEPGRTSRRELIRFVTDRPGHDRRYAMDITRIRTQLGWQPRHSLAQGLLLTVQWYLSHPDWVAAVAKQQDYQSWLDQNYGTREVQA
jgi:dTDP-glucose 4,6-dehydratase